MALTLAQFEARVSAKLVDASNLVYALATIDEALRTALHEYSDRLPLATDTVIVCPAASREQNLNSLTGLLQVSEVWFPFDSTADEQWPPYRVQGFELIWDDGQPVLRLSDRLGDQPQIDDEIRVWYTKRQTIQNLDSEAATTVLPDHETLLVTGAAGFALQSYAIDIANSITPNRRSSESFAKSGDKLVADFRAQLLKLPQRQPAGPPFGPSWSMDKWDRRGGESDLFRDMPRT